MRRIILILLFTSCFSNKLLPDIDQYKIAGVSLGSSILDVMSENEIIDNTVQRSSHGDQYFIINYNKDFSNFPETNNFDKIYFTIDIDDENFSIVAITMHKSYGTDFNSFKKDQKLLANKYEKIFKIKKEELPEKDFSSRYGTGSRWKAIIFEKPNFKIIKSNTASVLCYHYGMSTENELHGQDNLKVNILDRKFADAATVK